MEDKNNTAGGFSFNAIALSDSELAAVSGGKQAPKKFLCTRCRKNSMVVKFKKFVCLDCGYERPM